MTPKNVWKKIRAEVTVERVAIAVGAVVTYIYVMDKFDYRMVRPAYTTETHVIFNRPFAGTTAVRIGKD